MSKALVLALAALWLAAWLCGTYPLVAFSAHLAPIGTQPNQPAAPFPPPRVIALSGGARSSMALKSDGTVWDWGMNWHGKLGDNTVSVFLDPLNYSGGSHDRHM